MKNNQPKYAIINAEELTASDVVHKAVLCPACKTKIFEKWPEGWDGHVGWKCSGVKGTLPEERKEEYKKRFKHLFR